MQKYSVLDESSYKSGTIKITIWWNLIIKADYARIYSKLTVNHIGNCYTIVRFTYVDLHYHRYHYLLYLKFSHIKFIIYEQQQLIGTIKIKTDFKIYGVTTFYIPTRYISVLLLYAMKGKW